MQPSDHSARSADPRAFARGSAVLLAFGCAALLLAGPALGRTADLFPDVLPAAPYWLPAHAWLLYLLLPLAVAGAVVVLLAPGAFLILGIARRAPLEDLALKGFLASFVLNSALAGACSRAFAEPRVSYVVSLISAAWLSWLWAVRRGGAVTQGAVAARRAGWMIALPAAAMTLLLPILVWLDLNPDGLELFTMGRSLGDHVLPRVPNGALSGLGLGMVAAAFPVQWWISIAGPIDAAVRLPVLVYLPLLFAGVVGVAEAARPDGEPSEGERRLRGVDEGLVAIGVLVLVAALAFNSTYHPYAADIASPASIDLLAAVCLLGALRAYMLDARWWFVAFTVAGYFARPIALLACALLVAGHVAVYRGGRRSTLVTLVVGLASCVLAALLYEQALAGWLELPLEEPSAGVTGRRLRWLLFADWPRAVSVVVLSGIVPAVSLAAVRFQDEAARVLALAAGLFFAFFWFPAFYALHHFLPVALLALVVHWRVVAVRIGRHSWRAATLAGLTVALMLALPRSFEIDRSSRTLAAQIDWRIGDYNGAFDGWRRAFEAKHLLETLFPNFETVTDPSREFSPGAWVLVHYASVVKERRGTINYLALPPQQEGPAGWTKVAGDHSGSIWMLDRDRWQFSLTHPPSTEFRSRALATPRAALLPLWGVPAGRYDVDLRDLRDRLFGTP